VSAGRDKNFIEWLQEMHRLVRIDPVSNSHNSIVVAPVWKQVLDLLCIIVALPAVLMTMLLIAVLIKLVSRGPVLIRQERIGLGCRRFGCFKFRTMRVDADTGVHRQHVKDLLHNNTPMVKMDAIGDPRLIRFGAILRASGLDELPQLINVVLGEMSLVGPRPCLPYEFELYEPWQRERFDTLPGLTGLWQVRGKNRTTFTEMIQLDIRYVRTKSLLLDLQILLGTFGALVAQIRRLQSRGPRRVEDVNPCASRDRVPRPRRVQEPVH
jgi:lipopolysaccharide/colanic/teichoic acid biosynthesis glycosyltransferase